MTNHARTEQNMDVFLHLHALAAAFSAVTPIGPWFWPADLRGWRVLLAVVVALTVLLGFVWQYQVRAAGRWKVALDAHAERKTARDRRLEAPPTTVEAEGRNSNSFKTLKDHLTGELTDLAYPVVLRQGVERSSVDAELAIWKAIDGTLQEMLQPLVARAALRPPAWGIVLARMTKTVYRVALRHGFRGTLADVEFGLWDAFHARSFPGHAQDLLHALFREARKALEARPARQSPAALSRVHSGLLQRE